MRALPYPVVPVQPRGSGVFVLGRCPGVVCLLCCFASLISVGADPPQEQTQGLSPLLRLVQNITNATEKPEFLTLWQNPVTESLKDQEPQNPSVNNAGPHIPAQTTQLYREGGSPEVWEHNVRPPHHQGEPAKPQDSQQQQQKQQNSQEPFLYGTTASIASEANETSSRKYRDAVHSFAYSPPFPDASAGHTVGGEAKGTATAFGQADRRKPEEVGGRYPLDSGHPHMGSPEGPKRFLKPMRTIAYGNIHQTAYYFAGRVP